MHEYRVGELYSKTRTRWPEAVEYNYRAGVHELRMFFAGVTSGDIRDVTKGIAEFGLLVYKDIIFFLYRFGERVPWSDAPFSYHILKQQYPNEATIPEPAEVPEPHDTLQVILIDANTGIIRGLRLVSLSPAFTAALRLAIREQAQRPWPGDAAYDREQAEAYRHWPNSQAMVKDASVRTLGGV